MTDLSTSSGLADLSPGDAEAAQALSRAEGWPHDLRDWRTMLELGQGVGVRAGDGRLAAVGLVFLYGDHAATAGMIMVSAGHRGQGLGRLVMAEVLRRAGPERSVWLYATEQGLPLYRSLGFEETSASLSYRGDLTETVRPRDGAVRPATAGDLSRIRALDLEVFGAARGAVIDRLLENEGRLCLAGAPGAVTGYALIRAVGSGWQIGPVVAADQAEAFDLIAFLGRGAGRPLRIDLPESATGLRRALDGAGLAALPREPLMVRGPALPGDQSRLYAVASSAYG